MLIHDVVVSPLKQIENHRGKVMHMLRCDSPVFASFGEVYFSVVHQGAVKAWKCHKKMTLNLAVPFGCVKFVLFEDREASPSRGKVQEVVSGEERYCLITVPPGIWNGFQGVANPSSIIANCATLPHDPEEVDRQDPFTASIPYRWEERG